MLPILLNIVLFHQNFIGRLASSPLCLYICRDKEMS